MDVITEVNHVSESTPPFLDIVTDTYMSFTPVHWGEPHDGCNCNHRQHGCGEESAAKRFRFVPLV